MRAWIRKRPPKHGATFQVLYRRGGRAYRIEYAGTFATRKDADKRCDTVQGWLAQGLDPVDELARRASAAPDHVRDCGAGVAVLAGRRGRELETGVPARGAYWSGVFAGRDPRTLTVADLQQTIAGSELAPRTLRMYRAALRGILDHAGVEPNPARSALRWPWIERADEPAAGRGRGRDPRAAVGAAAPAAGRA